MPNTIVLTGFKEFEGKLANLPEKIRKEVGAEIYFAGKEWESLAKQSAPVDKGRLRNEIRAVKVSDIQVDVVVNIEYAPYVEWGTGGKVSVPADLKEYALQFKGTVKVVGIRPQPFFFIHKQAVTTRLIQNIQKVINSFD